MGLGKLEIANVYLSANSHGKYLKLIEGNALDFSK